ncbi:hypothetical protein D1164_02745 [Mariniphaga sediminis]|uniref:Uncharacterized protein n=1 Tax=Mariniphaga sediminis TaxID=1628158 RepID=A0A399D0R5_9BACT|nr:hypothetical protein D1164_15700 [Mariniphaga sediminis]RIH66540.1 hypothetical protein D1164_02745 [Mariniphaga sediminis]
MLQARYNTLGKLPGEGKWLTDRDHHGDMLYLAINVHLWTSLFYQFLALAVPDAGCVKIPSVGPVRQIEKTQRLILT